MDAARSRRYLQAMGVQLWRLRREESCAAPVPDAPAASKGPRPLFPQPVAQPVEAIGEAQEQAPAVLPATAAVPAIAAPTASPPASPMAPQADLAPDWEDLRQAVTVCRACALCETRTQTVFGIGSKTADLMVIGEAPGADEDRQGEPFVGRAGQLLDLMLAAIGLARDQVYIANILKCRPPGNRDPRPEEALRCKPYLMRQIALVKPRVLLSVGRVSAQNLLATDTPIGRLRGHWFALGPEQIPLMITYHPAYLLRSPEQKSKAWADLVEVARRLRETQAD